MAEYVVQAAAPNGDWRDIATVEVPARTHRDTIIRKALDGLQLGKDGPETVRVLDERCARGTTVTLEPRDPELRIG